MVRASVSFPPGSHSPDKSATKSPFRKVHLWTGFNHHQQQMNEISNDDRDVPGGPMVRTVLPKLGAGGGGRRGSRGGFDPWSRNEGPSSTRYNQNIKKKFFFLNFFKKVKAGKNDAHKYKDRRCTCFLLTPSKALNCKIFPDPSHSPRAWRVLVPRTLGTWFHLQYQLKRFIDYATQLPALMIQQARR